MNNLGFSCDSKNACNYKLFFSFYAQAFVASNQDESEKGKEANSNMILEDNDTCDDHTIMPWDYERANVIYL